MPLKMPVNHFDELSRDLPPTVLENLHHVNGPPTTLQQYALPVHLEGRDLIVLGASMQDQVSCVMASSIAGVLKARHSAREPGCCRPRALVLVPTREHAQVAEVLATGLARGTGLQCALAYGGHSIERSLEELVKDPGLLIATPTRLLDLTGAHWSIHHHSALLHAPAPRFNLTSVFHRAWGSTAECGEVLGHCGGGHAARVWVLAAATTGNFVICIRER